MKNNSNIPPIPTIPPITFANLNQLTDFSFDIFCRLQSTKNVDCSRIKKYGVLNPIWICGKSLIAGFEQFAAARAAGLSEIPAFILPENTSKEVQLDLALELIAAKKQIPLMPMARLAILTENIVENPVKWLRERHNQHFWSITIDIFCRLKSLALSPVETRAYFQKFDAPLNSAMSVINLNSEFQQQIINFANEKRVRPIELEKIITDVTDCAKVEKTSPEKIWNEIFDDDKNLLKKNLDERKNPTLTKLRKEKSEQIKEFEKATGIKISYDPDFENPEIEFKFKCKSEKEFDKILKMAIQKNKPIWSNGVIL